MFVMFSSLSLVLLTLNLTVACLPPMRRWRPHVTNDTGAFGCHLDRHVIRDFLASAVSDKISGFGGKCKYYV